MDKKRVLITGATGFIGQALAGELASGGYEVVALTRNIAKSTGLFGKHIQSVYWDGRTADGWGSLADGAHAIINLAGDNLAEGRWTRAKKDLILKSRLGAGAAVCDAVRGARRKPTVVIQASAVGIYGSRGDEDIDESSAAGRGFLADVVRAWEDSTREVEAHGVRRVVIRSGLVLGRGGGVFPRLLLPFRFFAGGPLGSGRQWFSWVHMSDEAGAIRFLVERDGLAGVFNLTAPNPVEEKDICRAIGKALRRPCWLPVPGFVLKLLFGDKAKETILEGQRVFPRRLAEAGFPFRFPDADAALAELLRKS